LGQYTTNVWPNIQLILGQYRTEQVPVLICDSCTHRILSPSCHLGGGGLGLGNKISPPKNWWRNLKLLTDISLFPKFSPPPLRNFGLRQQVRKPPMLFPYELALDAIGEGPGLLLCRRMFTLSKLAGLCLGLVGRTRDCLHRDRLPGLASGSMTEPLLWKVLSQGSLHPHTAAPARSPHYMKQRMSFTAKASVKYRPSGGGPHQHG